MKLNFKFDKDTYYYPETSPNCNYDYGTDWALSAVIMAHEEVLDKQKLLDRVLKIYYR